jgi:hypothetical protein
VTGVWLARSCEVYGDGDRREEPIERRTPRLAPIDADGRFCFLWHEQVFSQPSEFRASPGRGILAAKTPRVRNATALRSVLAV